MPKGYKARPIIPKTVKASTIAKNINSGRYDVVVFYTAITAYAPIVRRVEGEEAISLALRLLNEWADYKGRVEKCLLSTCKHCLHKDFLGYRNLYTKLFSPQHELIALIKK